MSVRVSVLKRVVSTCVGMEESLRMISLPLQSWAVTILRTGGSVVRDCDMVFVNKRGGMGEMGGRRIRGWRHDSSSLIYSPWRSSRRTDWRDQTKENITREDTVTWYGNTR